MPSYGYCYFLWNYCCLSGFHCDVHVFLACWWSKSCLLNGWVPILCLDWHVSIKPQAFTDGRRLVEAPRCSAAPKCKRLATCKWKASSIILRRRSYKPHKIFSVAIPILLWSPAIGGYPCVAQDFQPAWCWNTRDYFLSCTFLRGSSFAAKTACLKDEILVWSEADETLKLLFREYTYYIYYLLNER